MDNSTDAATEVSERSRIGASQLTRVGFVLLEGFPLMSYAAAMEPLRAANMLAGRRLYDIRHLALEGHRAMSSSGASISTTTLADEPIDFDLVLIVAGGDLTQMHCPQLSSWLRTLASRNVLIGGVSGGPLLLARAGIMDGRRMTIHWEHAQLLAAASSRLIIERSLYVRDRDRLTCAGGSAPLDMMHTLIAEQHGPAIAQKVSDWFLHTDIRPAENAQRAGIAERYGVRLPALVISLEAMENHLADPLALTQLASLAGLGVRQLNRLFRSQLQTSTIEFYRLMRLQKAQGLLRSTAWSVDDISQATGFADGAHLSRLFKAHFSVSPSEFRRCAVTRQGN